MATYVVSDIHGYMDLFRKGLEIIDFKPEDTLYVIGDAIDRGPSGIEILRLIKDSENMDLLPGNHEMLMMESVSLRGIPFCTGPQKELWLYYNGGEITFREYTGLSRNERLDLLEWLGSRVLIKPLEINGRKIVLTHSFYLPELENIEYKNLDYNQAWSITWKSMFRSEPEVHIENIYQNYEDITFITGHVPVFRARSSRYTGEVSDEEINLLKPIVIGNLWNIDGGCAIGPNTKRLRNGLIFLRLDDMESFSMEFEKNI